MAAGPTEREIRQRLLPDKGLQFYLAHLGEGMVEKRRKESVPKQIILFLQKETRRKKQERGGGRTVVSREFKTYQLHVMYRPHVKPDSHT